MHFQELKFNILSQKSKPTELKYLFIKDNQRVWLGQMVKAIQKKITKGSLKIFPKNFDLKRLGETNLNYDLSPLINYDKFI